MENIFENAHFGKLYKTRDGRKAIFHKRKLAREVGKGVTERFYLICDKVDYELSCFKDGKTSSFCENIEDIISEWQEPIDEEKIDKLAIKLIYETIDDFQDGEKVTFNLLKDLVKAGYCTAKGEK